MANQIPKKRDLITSEERRQMDKNKKVTITGENLNIERDDPYDHSEPETRIKEEFIPETTTKMEQSKDIPGNIVNETIKIGKTDRSMSSQSWYMVILVLAMILPFVLILIGMITGRNETILIQALALMSNSISIIVGGVLGRNDKGDRNKKDEK